MTPSQKTIFWAAWFILLLATVYLPCRAGADQTAIGLMIVQFVAVGAVGFVVIGGGRRSHQRVRSLRFRR